MLLQILSVAQQIETKGTSTVPLSKQQLKSGYLSIHLLHQQLAVMEMWFHEGVTAVGVQRQHTNIGAKHKNDHNKHT